MVYGLLQVDDDARDSAVPGGGGRDRVRLRAEEPAQGGAQHVRAPTVCITLVTLSVVCIILVTL